MHSKFSDARLGLACPKDQLTQGNAGQENLVGLTKLGRLPPVLR